MWRRLARSPLALAARRSSSYSQPPNLDYARAARSARRMAADTLMLQLQDLPAAACVSRLGVDPAIAVPVSRRDVLALDALDDAALRPALAQRGRAARARRAGMAEACASQAFLDDAALYAARAYRLGHIDALPVVELAYRDEPGGGDDAAGDGLRPHQILRARTRSGARWTRPSAASGTRDCARRGRTRCARGALSRTRPAPADLA